MKRIEMIKDKNVFNNMIRKSKFVKDKNYVIYYKKNSENKFSHFGIAIKNSIGKAYIRNRLKRQTRAIVDENKKMFKKDHDYIIMIRDGCLINNYQQMNKSIVDLMKGNKNAQK